MTLDHTAPMGDYVEDELIDYLVDHCGLTDGAAGQIREIMRTEHVNSSEAAVLSGLLTDEQAESAIKWVHGRTDPFMKDGIFEAALRRSGRQLVPKARVSGPEVRPGPELLYAHDSYSPRSEKMRSLRTELLLLNSSPTLMLAVVGAGEGEGRSLLAAELALAFGQLGGRTLLVDADLRKPRQHVLFQTTNTFGLAQSIDGRHPDIMYPIAGFPAMALLTAGTAPPNPLELLSDVRFERLADSWRKYFEFIIIDTPPIGRFSDALTVATVAGRVLVVGHSEATKFRELKDMLRRLALTQSQVLGAVINDF